MFVEIIIENSNNFKMKKFEQRSIKIHWNTLNELIEKINTLGAASEHDLKITECSPDITGLMKCSKINYWKQI